MANRAVFLSYASEDSAAALRISEALRAAGIEVWFDQSELRGGEAWDRQIRKQIHDCALFVALISAHSNARSEGYFRREWRLAVERTHDMADDTAFLLPVVIDDTAEPVARVPEPFREVQWARFQGGQAPARFVEQVLRLLEPTEPTPASQATTARTEPAGSGAAPVAGAAATHRGRRPRSRRGLMVAIAIAIAVAAGALTTWRFRPSHDAAAAPPANAGWSAVQQKSIAVLPFADMSEKKDQEYFADGMAEEILDLLEKIPELRVIGRTSSFQFKARNEDLRSIGEKLGAAYLVEGSVRRAGSRVRVSAQLIDAGTGTQLWADNYDREFGDILDLQDQVAAGIARALQLAVASDDASPRRQLQSPEAYTHFLRGRAGIDRGDAESLRAAVGELEQALALDPGFTRAAETLALAYLDLIGNGYVTSKVGWPPTVVAAHRALQLDPGSALAHAIIGLHHATFEYDWPAARAELQQALAQDSRDPVALYNVAWLAFDLGQIEESIHLQNLSMSLDPLNPDALQNGAIIYFLTGDFAAAERSFRAGMQISPGYPANHWYLGQMDLLRGEPAAALVEMRAEPSVARDQGLAMVYHALGRHAESDAALARALRSVGNESPINVAIVYAYRRERDQAFAWLKKAVDERDLIVGHKFLHDPTLEPLRGDPRYKALLRKMNLPDK